MDANCPARAHSFPKTKENINSPNAKITPKTMEPTINIFRCNLIVKSDKRRWAV